MVPIFLSRLTPSSYRSAESPGLTMDPQRESLSPSSISSATKESSSMEIPSKGKSSQSPDSNSLANSSKSEEESELTGSEK